MIGPDVMIFTQNHRHDRLDIPMRLQTDPKRPVVIEDDVWIGARVIILPGVTIHKEPLLVREPLSQRRAGICHSGRESCKGYKIQGRKRSLTWEI